MPSTSNIEKLLKKIAKPVRNAGSKRTLHPWTSRRRRQYQKLSKQERKELQARRDDNRAALKTALNAARAELYQKAAEIATQFGNKHTPSYYYRLIMQKSKLQEEPRKVSLWNAYVSKEVQKYNAEIASGHRESVSKGIIKEIARKWRSLTPEEREAEVGDRLEELQDRQSDRKLVVHNEPLAAFNDTRATLALIQRELEFLKGRTDTDVLFIAVRSKLDFWNAPYVFWSNERVATFWETLTKKNLPDLALQMEGFSISGLESIVRKHADELLFVKKQAADLILEKLREASLPARGSITKMYYTNFEKHITLKHGIVLQNWPLQQFLAPGKFSSIPLLQMLCDCFKQGTSRFVALSDAEWMAWRTAYHAGTHTPGVSGAIPAAFAAALEDQNAATPADAASTQPPTTSTATTTPAPETMLASPPTTTTTPAPENTTSTTLSTTTTPAPENTTSTTPSTTLDAAPAPAPMSFSNVDPIPLFVIDPALLTPSSNTAPPSSEHTAATTATQDPALQTNTTAQNLPTAPTPDTSSAPQGTKRGPGDFVPYNPHLPKKPRKVRSDKDKPRGPRKKGQSAQENNV